MNQEQKERLSALVKQDPHISMSDAATTLGVTQEEIRRHIKCEHGSSTDWESYTGISRHQRTARSRALRAAEDARNDNIEQMVAKAAQEIGKTKLGLIASHLGLTRNEVVYRMQRRGTNLAKILQEHANIGVQKESLVSVIERELLANHDLTRKEFADSIGISVNSVVRTLSKHHGTTWEAVKKRTLKDLPTRANNALKALILVADNPEARTICRAARMIGENPQYIRRLLERRKISWGEMFSAQTKPAKPEKPAEQALIVVPGHLVMPLRSYRHSKLVYNNTDARI